MVNEVLIDATVRRTLTSIDRTIRALEETSARLATGKKVNSALDSPQNFFTARALQNRASDFNRVLDGIGQSIRTIEEALFGVEALERLIDQAEAIANESRRYLLAGEPDPAVETVSVDNSPTPLSTQIIADGADVYFRLNSAGAVQADTGVAGAGVGATLTGGATPGAPALYTNGGASSVDFDGINDRVTVNNDALINLVSRPERTIELVFNADTVTGRQVLYEEGGGVNSFTIYIDNGTLYVVGRDQGAWGPPNTITAPVVAGQTYHVALVFDQPNNRFEGFLDGASLGSVGVAGAIFPSHSGGIGIGGLNGNAWFHDGVFSGALNFDGRISDVAIFNTALSDAQIQSHADSLLSVVGTQIVNRDFEQVLEAIDELVMDANYRGINLLGGEDLTTFFNPEGTSTLITEGQKFTYSGLGISILPFDSLENVEAMIESIREARNEVRAYGRLLANDLTIISRREDFTKGLINSHLAGADDLTLADINKTGAEQLAAQVRLNIGYSTLATTAQAPSVLDLFSGGQS